MRDVKRAQARASDTQADDRRGFGGCLGRIAGAVGALRGFISA